jgi:hypothetical protein
VLELPFKSLNFDPIEHKYTDDKGQVYISVTTLIQDDFDAEKIAARVIKSPRSKYYGMEKQAVLDMWAQSAPLGTLVHEAVEDYILHKKVTTNPEITPLVNQFAKLNFKGQLLTETVLHDEEYRLAGTADILEWFDDCLWLFDIKTSVPKPNGIDMAPDKIHKYSLQLEIYKRLVEKCFGKPCNIGGIFWYKDFAKLRGKTKLQFQAVRDVSEEVDQILQKRKWELIEED